MTVEKLSHELQLLNPPWCHFTSDQEFQGSFNRLSDKGLRIIRKMVYLLYPDSPFITQGVLPAVLGPIFWKVNSGQDRVQIFAFNKPPISENTYEHNKELYEIIKQIPTILLINPKALRNRLLTLYKQNNCNENERNHDLEERLSALCLLEKSIQDQIWHKRLILVPTCPVEEQYESFTISNHLKMSISRSKDGSDSPGHLYYSPKQNDYLEGTFQSIWEACKKYGQSRIDWPDLEEVNHIILNRQKCLRFNLNSVKILKLMITDLKTQINLVNEKTIMANDPINHDRIKPLFSTYSFSESNKPYQPMEKLTTPLEIYVPILNEPLNKITVREENSIHDIWSSARFNISYRQHFNKYKMPKYHQLNSSLRFINIVLTNSDDIISPLETDNLQSLELGIFLSVFHHDYGSQLRPNFDFICLTGAVTEEDGVRFNFINNVQNIASKFVCFGQFLLNLDLKNNNSKYCFIYKADTEPANYQLTLPHELKPYINDRIFIQQLKTANFIDFLNIVYGNIEDITWLP